MITHSPVPHDVSTESRLRSDGVALDFRGVCKTCPRVSFRWHSRQALAVADADDHAASRVAYVIRWVA